MMITVVDPPENYPISLADVKKHLVIEHDEDDDLIETYLKSVIAMLDPPYGFLGRAMVTQTLKYWRETIPAGKIIKIPFPPLQSVTSVKYYDSDEAEQTISSDDYTVVTSHEPGYVELSTNKSWPTSLSERKYPVFIEFIAGYGDCCDLYEPVPADLRQWILLSVADFYMQREHLNPYQLSHNKFTMNIIENHRFYFYD